MAPSRPTSAQIAAVSVGFTVAGMLAGAALVLATDHRAVGWLLFVLSFGGWLPAALLAMREGWHRGWFDR